MEGDRPVMDAKALLRSDWHAATMYFLMVDRSGNGNPGQRRTCVRFVDQAPAANHLGGDLEGVLHTLQEGYFDSLGMNTVSPVTQNAEGAWGLWQDSARTDVQPLQQLPRLLARDLHLKWTADTEDNPQ